MKFFNKLIFAIPLVLCMFFSCQKDAVIDGGVSDPHVNMTTYDYLKSHPHGLFDTLLQIVDRAEMKDLINTKGTMFVPTDYSIKSYLAVRQSEARRIDERRDYTLDSLFKYYTPQMLRDSMAVYIFPEDITRDILDENGTEFSSKTGPYKFLITLEEHENNDYSGDGLISTRPKFMFFSRVVGEKDIIEGGVRKDPSGDADKVDMRNICQTTGIMTNTGIIHVIENSHTWLRSVKLTLN